MSFFKAYDMRGEFGKDFTLDTVYRVGRWLPSLLEGRRFLVGRDMRLSSPAMRDALCCGLNDAGADVDDMGLATTPMTYFFTTEKNYDASVQITASHNPPEHNGMKVSMRGSLPMGADSGLPELERRVLSGNLLEPAPGRGTTRTVKYRDEFVNWLIARKPPLTGLHFAVDCSDGMAGILVRDLFGTGTIYLNDTPDGRFPHHSPNPLMPESRRQISDVVKAQGLDCGVIYDGDADRVMFVDERGEFIQPDYLIPIIARHFLKTEPGATVIHDIRTSRGAIEALKADGAKPVMGKVGHAFAKLLLRKVGAVCGGELAGHYYFRDFCNCDSGELASLLVLGALSEAKARGLTFSQLMAPIMRFATTGERNFLIQEKDEAMAAAVAAMEREYGKPMAVEDFDGIRLEYRAGWVNIRKSNTEPYLRMIVEAEGVATRDAWFGLLSSILEPFET